MLILLPGGVQTGVSAGHRRCQPQVAGRVRPGLGGPGADGGAYAKYTGDDQFRGFFAELQRAAEPLHRAAELLPHDPAPWSELQWHGIGSQLPRPELDHVWDELRQRDPANFDGAFGRVQAISEKWYGDPGESAAFAEELVSDAEPGSPIVAIAAVAHLEIVWPQVNNSEETSSEFLRRYFAEARVAGLMRRASDLWGREPKPHPQDREAHHLLGAVHYFGGDRDRARFRLSHAGDSMPKKLPWNVAAVLAGRYYKKVRRELGL